MQVYSFRIKSILFFLCIFSIRVHGQNIEKQSHEKGNPPDSLTYEPTLQKNSKPVDDMIYFAKKFLGTPYRYAGSTPSGFDCSGFISYIFGNFGLSIVHSSYGMAELGKTVKLSEIRPGDLLFFKGSDVHSTKIGHVAMVVEVTPSAINFIHSSSSKGVTIENFKTSSYFIPRYIKAKRMDYGEN
jgi:cell wall-associated NlpC family hydrolase